MDPNELLRESRKKFNQILLAERHLLDIRKSEMFMQMIDNAIHGRLLLLLGNKTIEGDFTK